MTVDGLPLSKVALNFFVYSVKSRRPELVLHLMMCFNPDLAQMQTVNSFCFWAACRPYSQHWWVTFWLIWQDFPSGITASYLSEDYRIIYFNWQLPFLVDDVTQWACQKIVLYSNQVGRVAGKKPGNLPVWARNKHTSWEQAQQISKKHVDELMNMGHRDQTCWNEGDWEGGGGGDACGGWGNRKCNGLL